MLRFTLFIFALLVSPLAANANNIYEVKNIAVSIQEPDAMKAREKAFSEAQTKAFQQLQKKLSENGYIQGTPSNPTAVQVQNAVSSIDVVNEKILPGNYKATYNIIFNEAQVSKLFQISPIKTTTQGERFLVVPIVLEVNGVRLWKNDWRKTWQGLKSDDIILPLGDLQDIRNFKNEDIAASQYDGIFRMQKRYGATAVVLIQAEYIANMSALQVQLELIKNNDRTVINYEYPGGSGITAKDLFDAAANDLAMRLENDKLTDENAFADSTLPVEALAPLPGVASPAAKLPEPYSPLAPGTGYIGSPAAPLPSIPPATGNITPPVSATASIPAGTIHATVIAPDLIAWNRIRNKIVVSPGVNNLEIKSFTSGQASISFTHSTDLETIRQTLDSKGLLLIGTGPNFEIMEK